MNIFCLIHREHHQYFFFILFGASSFLYAFPFLRVIGLGRTHFSWNIKYIQTHLHHIGPVVMIYHFKNPHSNKEHNKGWVRWSIRSKEPLAIHLLLMQGLTRPWSCCPVGRSFVLKLWDYTQMHTHTHSIQHTLNTHTYAYYPGLLTLASSLFMRMNPFHTEQKMTTGCSIPGLIYR